MNLIGEFFQLRTNTIGTPIILSNQQRNDKSLQEYNHDWIIDISDLVHQTQTHPCSDTRVHCEQSPHDTVYREKTVHERELSTREFDEGVLLITRR